MLKIRAQDQLIDATRNADDDDLETITPTNVEKTGGFPQELRDIRWFESNASEKY